MAKRTVTTTMTGFPVPSTTSSSPGAVMDHNPAAPFTKPHSTGGGGIPLKFTESIPGATEALRTVEGTRAPGLVAPANASTGTTARVKATPPSNNK